LSAILMPGAPVADAVYADVTERVAKLAALGRSVGLATILVGDDPSSAAYVGKKHEACERCGLASIDVRISADSSQEDLLEAVAQLNADPAVDAYLLQHPVPPGFDFNEAVSAMDPAKDADGLHPISLGKLVLGQEAPLPCTPKGCVELLRRYGIPIAGKHVVVIGRGITAGRPMGLIFTRRSENATVTQCHTGTTNLAEMVRTGDIVISAAGSAGLITAGMVKPGAVLLDVGTSRNAAGKLTGDIDQAAREVASWIAPMPGGIGPMTRAMLLTNVVEAAEAGRR